MRRTLARTATALSRVPSGVPIAAEAGFVRAHPWYRDGTSNDTVDNTVDSSTLFAGRRVAMFAVPAPWTGTCTEEHVPGFMRLASEFADCVDELVCLSVSDPYSMHAWKESLGVGDEITFLSDPSSAAVEQWGLQWDLSAVSLGSRSKRFSLFADDGAVKAFNYVEDATADAALLLSQCKP